MLDKGNTSQVIDGKVRVVNGEIVIKNPSGGGQKASISPDKEVGLFVDGVQVKGTVLVDEQSKIKVEIPEKKPLGTVNITVSVDKLEAIVNIKYENGYKYKIRDITAHNAVLYAQPSFTVACPRYTVDEVKSILKTNGVVFGIDEKALLEVVEKGGSAVIAKGTAYVAGSDDKIELKFQQNKGLEEINGKVDYHSKGKITSVDENELIALRIRGSQGKAGVDVSGKPILPPGNRQLKLKAGSGVRLSDDGLSAYSSITGRPEYKNGILSVLEVYEVIGDVDISTGNIEFSGDIIIRENVIEGMKVTAGNNVTIYGSVSGAEIAAGGDITIYNNLIRSKIKAGCRDVLLMRFMELFKSIEKIISGMFSDVQSLKESGKIPIIYKDGQLIKGLLDTRYKKGVKLVAELRSALQTDRDAIDMDTLQCGVKVIKLLTGRGTLMIENYKELLSISRDLKDRILWMEEQQKQPSNVSVSYVQNSEVSTSGNISVNGKGCYNSEIYCKGDIEFSGIGFVRGGTLTAGGNVKLHELGSSGSAFTVVKTGRESYISSNVVHPNCILDVGGMTCRIDIPSSKVKAYIYKGELMVEKSRL